MNGPVAAIVPIKEHSERIPGKNFKEFNGKPLFQWILRTLEAAESVSEIVVDTDSQQVRDEAPKVTDITLIDRPENLQGDETSMNRILRHDIDRIHYDHILQTHCTNPLLRPETVDDAIATFRNLTEKDSLFSVTPLQTRLWNKDIKPLNHERGELIPTQELPMVFEENSNIYIFCRETMIRHDNRIGKFPYFYEMEPREAVDIDEMIDFEIAEFLHKRRYGSEPSFDDVIRV